MLLFINSISMAVYMVVIVSMEPISTCMENDLPLGASDGIQPVIVSLVTYNTHTVTIPGAQYLEVKRKHRSGRKR